MVEDVPAVRKQSLGGHRNFHGCGFDAALDIRRGEGVRNFFDFVKINSPGHYGLLHR